MSQAGELNVVQNHPEIPTEFVTDSGTAVPIANTLDILGTVVNAHAVPVQTTGASNVVHVTVQLAAAEASSNDLNAGLASFNSSQFTVDSNGYVSLSGSGAVEQFTVDAHTAPGTNPVGPNGSGIVTITGAQVAAGTTTNVIRTDSLAANTYTIEVQRSQAVGVSTIGDNGVSHYSSGQFSVDANGFVTLAGGSGPPVLDFIVQAGTTPVVPSSGAITFNGATVAAGTHPVRTDGTGANTMALEVQISQAIASTDATKIGLAAFNSAEFTVDANGFVGLVGGGSAIEKVNLDTGTTPITPTSGAITLTGSTVAAGTHPIRTDGTGASTASIEVQFSQAIGSTNATNVGLAAFNSAQFSVDANGFVSASGAVPIQFTASDATTATPSGGNINLFGTGSITTTASGSTVTTELTGLTNHNVLVGAGTTTITKVAPSATAGVPLISNGASSDPLFGTAVVAGGGTGDTSFTAYAVICGGTTSTGSLQNVSGVGTAGQVLTSNGAGALPTWQNGGSVLTITSVNHAASPYTVLSTDEFIACQTSTGTITINLPNSTTTGRVIYIKDSNGAASTSNISVTTPGGTVTIDGQTTYKITSNYGSINVIFDGTNYEVY